jgi:4-hydroxymandelate oxidase
VKANRGKSKKTKTLPPPRGAKGGLRGDSRAACLADYEMLAKRKMSHAAWEYFASGSGDQITLRRNREALTAQCLRPRVMIDVCKIDTRITLFDHEMPHPILLAPTSSHLLAHPGGEEEMVRGAGAAQAITVISTSATCSIEKIADTATSPLWFQLYVVEDRVKVKELIQRAEAAGCRALCITVDLPYIYARNRESQIAGETPEFYFPHLHVRARPGSAGGKGGRSRAFTWKDMDWIHSFVKVPVLLKGILDPDDADIAVKSGAAGIIVSNHGGRGLDSLPATFEALPGVSERVAKRVPVLVDGGIQRGTDIVKMMAHGAAAVLIGRPCLYGLGVAGAEGVRHVIEILRTEFEAAMGLCGRISIDAIDRSVLW